MALDVGFQEGEDIYLGHFQVGSYRYRSLIEGLYTLWKPYRSPIYPKLPTLLSLARTILAVAKNRPSCLN